VTTLSGGLADIPTLVSSCRAFAVGSAWCWPGRRSARPATRDQNCVQDERRETLETESTTQARPLGSIYRFSASYRCAFLRAKGIFWLKRLLPLVELAMAQKLSRVA